MIRGVAILVISACPVLGQPATFEVASVKSSKLAGEGSRRERIESPPGSLIMSNVVHKGHGGRIGCRTADHRTGLINDNASVS